jgi:lipopolysaccharide biosynthesis glycosyltransferase
MKILLTFDTGYAPHAATVMESIIQNCPEKLKFAVIYYDLSDEVRRALTDHFAEKVESLEFHKVEKSILTDALGHIKSAEHLAGFNTYLRLFAPMVLTDDTHVIYLDCDTIVQNNILNILNAADLSKPICAVVEYDSSYKYRNLMDLQPIEQSPKDPFIYEAYWSRTYRDLDMRFDAKYFNAGVLVINLNYWREHTITEKTLKFLFENPKKNFSADQDALNHVLNGDFHPLHPKWNNLAVWSAVFSNYSAHELQEANSFPSIIHVAGPVKPWHYMGVRRYQKIYRKYRKLTPWPNIEYKNKTIKQILRKTIFLPIAAFINKPLTKFAYKFGIPLYWLRRKTNMYWAKARL